MGISGGGGGRLSVQSLDHHHVSSPHPDQWYPGHVAAADRLSVTFLIV